MAVGYNNVDVEAANKYGIAVGNTPVKTTGCSFLVGLYNWRSTGNQSFTSFCLSWIGSVDWDYGRASRFAFPCCRKKDCWSWRFHESWLVRRMASSSVRQNQENQETTLEMLRWLFGSGRFVGNLLKGQTVGVIGAGRIGSAYARMMVKPLLLDIFTFDQGRSWRDTNIRLGPQNMYRIIQRSNQLINISSFSLEKNMGFKNIHFNAFLFSIIVDYKLRRN